MSRASTASEPTRIAVFGSVAERPARRRTQLTTPPRFLSPSAAAVFERTLELITTKAPVIAAPILDRGVAVGTMTTLLAWQGNAVVGCAAIFRDPHSWSPHVGELRVVTSPSVRGKGAGRALIQHCFALMLQSGIEKIVAHMTIDQQGAIAVFESLGFRSEGLLREHVQDRDGKRHDIVILSHDVAKVLGQMTAYGVTRAF